jgi:hypothetical protein
MGSPVRIWALAALLICCASAASAQYFGRNKVHYDEIDFRVLPTEHFDVYHAHEDAAAAHLAARLAERWYTRLSRALDFELSGRQPLILYGSHRRFEQTNVVAGIVPESVGGITESRKRRILLPFAASLAETDHVLGHEIVHAFQYDIADRHDTGLLLPLWLIEGMAEYLSLGPGDPLTAMWMRDAVRERKLPAIDELASRRFFPYRYGAAVWDYLAGRFGDDLPARVLRAKGEAKKRIEQATGLTLEELSRDWHAALECEYAAPQDDAAAAPRARVLISQRQNGGRLNLGGSLSPDGRQIVFLSEKDRLSIDVYLADAATGRIQRKLLTTATTPEFESLQYLRSAGSWDPEGRRVALATIRNGRPAVTIIGVNGNKSVNHVPLLDLGEAFAPAWSPDGRSVVLSGLRRGVTDLYIVDVATGAIRQLTNDAYADLQPAWSPDGQTLAFVTDRFTSDLQTLRLGAYTIGLLDIASGAVRPAPPLGDVGHIDPAWSPDAASLYFVADPHGVSNVFRLDLRQGTFSKVTDVTTGVSGVTRLSPALSVAQQSGQLAYSQYRNGTYEIHVVDAPPLLAGTPVPSSEIAETRPGTEAAPAIEPRAGAAPGYESKLSLEALGTPYFAAGGGSFGAFMRGGMSFLFGDLLGNRQLFTAFEVSNRLNESAFHALYVNRESRLNWGAALDQSPDIRTWSRRVVGEETLTRERERSSRTHRRFWGFLAYPFNRSQRLELSAGVRHVSFERELETRTVAIATRREVGEERRRTAGEPSLVMGEVGLALVRDTTMFGPVGPILGSRYRLQISPVSGGLSYVTVLADYRRYVMPRRPFTAAFRIFHSGRYGSDADDPRLNEGYLGSSGLVRGYSPGWVTRAECGESAATCDGLDRLIGSRLLVGKAELRFPLLGVWSSSMQYGPLPVEGLMFADAGVMWGQGAAHRALSLRSVGAGMRINALGMALELTAVRPLDLGRRRWSFLVNFRPPF